MLKKLKILELTNFSAGICGVWQRVKQESLELSKRGHTVIIFSSNFAAKFNFFPSRRTVRVVWLPILHFCKIFARGFFYEWRKTNDEWRTTRFSRSREYAPVTHMDRVPGYEPGCSRFDPCQARQQKPCPCVNSAGFLFHRGKRSFPLMTFARNAWSVR